MIVKLLGFSYVSCSLCNDHETARVTLVIKTARNDHETARVTRDGHWS